MGAHQIVVDVLQDVIVIVILDVRDVKIYVQTDAVEDA